MTSIPHTHVIDLIIIIGTWRRARWENEQQIPSKTVLSTIISKELRNRGFKFVGATTTYAYIRAIGMVNDHLVHFFRHTEVQSRQPSNSLNR
ncbi:MAG: DNA-3-methyladenine glycosylase I [Candidatus Bathyarchaeota archaeon]|nr:DNA-3-methyladenine glycosylase I [Candidatus Bathyarchaeota archaeon]